MVFTVPLVLAEADGSWLRKVPAADRVRVNPLANDPDAAAAGEKLYRRNCASCHGGDARGRGSRPSLHSDRVREATDGELKWLLTNGNLAHGMPSWSRLPEAQRWQIVRYLRTLSVDEAPVKHLGR
jgi:mono/diheme cytochrome c family protein